jgi:NCAIR mutase (PurE)-related protein
MTKKKFETEIMRLIRKGINLEKTKLACTIWHEGCGDENTIYINTELLDEEYNALISGIAYNEVDDLEDNEDNLKLLKKEQKKIVNKIKKWLNPNWNINIIAEDQCV